MESIVELLNLPFGTLVVLGSGYIGYRLAYIGHDGPHGPADVVFISLSFAALAKAVMLIHGGSHILASIPAFAAVFLSALLWRLVLSPFFQERFRSSGMIDHDRGRNVWESMLMRTHLNVPTQVIVTLKNGRQLMCDDTQDFVSEPLGPCLFGPDGSVSLYVTAITSKDLTEWENADASDDGCGSAMTFIPAGEIERVRIRRRR